MSATPVQPLTMIIQRCMKRYCSQVWYMRHADSQDEIHRLYIFHALPEPSFCVPAGTLVPCESLRPCRRGKEYAEKAREAASELSLSRYCSVTTDLYLTSISASRTCMDSESFLPYSISYGDIIMTHGKFVLQTTIAGKSS